ncbi:hypothetical protein [Methanosarcina horonobensis]|uniref:hypothetical protein n=1 Tax=Methanosarcina horonobensis TaxID=418008 RepID=UPI00138DE226|nr:hypothetical protein [Methanosarcina horonobensis]
MNRLLGAHVPSLYRDGIGKYICFPVDEFSKKNPDAEQKLPELPGRGMGGIEK